MRYFNIFLCFVEKCFIELLIFFKYCFAKYLNISLIINKKTLKIKRPIK